MSSIRITVLGSGTSHGIPMIACDCPVCTSPDPHDKRTRTSIRVEINNHAMVIDTAPEFRIQCITNNVRRIDAILYTHHHSDHITGLDDLRRFNALQRMPLTCYADPITADVVEKMFAYAFCNNPDYPSHKPQLKMQQINGPFEIFGTHIIPVPLMHGTLPVLGFRIGTFAYCTDCSDIPEESFALLKNLEVFMLDGLRRRPHPTHFNLEQAVEIARRIGARQTFFTHIAHELPHDATNQELPDNMALAYDGQIITLPL